MCVCPRVHERVGTAGVPRTALCRAAQCGQPAPSPVAECWVRPQEAAGTRYRARTSGAKGSPSPGPPSSSGVLPCPYPGTTIIAPGCRAIKLKQSCNMKVKAPTQKHVFASMKKAWMLNRQARYQVQTNFAERETFMNQLIVVQGVENSQT